MVIGFTWGVNGMLRILALIAGSVFLAFGVIGCNSGSTSTPGEAEARVALERRLPDKNRMSIDSVKKVDGQLNGTSYLLVIDVVVKGCSQNDRHFVGCTNGGNFQMKLLFENMESGWVVRDYFWPY